jgi:signal transduction histidine kinase
MSPELPSNHLLQLLDADARSALSPVAVELCTRDVLHEPGTPTLYIYFPTTAVISLVSTMEGGASTEVALVGREGMVGLAGLLGTGERTTAVVQVGGSALRVSTAVMRHQGLRLPSVRAVLDRYIEARLIQVAQTAACNRLHSVKARLARYLLAVGDRLDDEYFTLPQELIAQMLGVHRPTVSVTLQGLRDAGVVAYRGRSIRIADRPGLERMACECYGVLRRESDRLLRAPIRGVEAMPQLMQSSVSREGELAAVLETMREISGRLLLATIREQEARDEAEAANRAKDQFLASVCHELRRPLNAILGWCATVTERPEDTWERGMTGIRWNAQASLELVEELLDAARLTSEKLSVRHVPINLRDVVCSATDAVKPTADTKGLVLRTTVDGAPIPLLADPDRLRQVFLNVLANALKFTDAGGMIDVSVTAAGGTARVSIRDTGAGIAPEHLLHVFERFRQGADSTAGQHGLGLGLTISRVLIELHGGTIQIASPGAGQGTTCTIELPLTVNAATAESLPSAARGQM